MWLWIARVCVGGAHSYSGDVIAAAAHTVATWQPARSAQRSSRAAHAHPHPRPTRQLPSAGACACQGNTLWQHRCLTVASSLPHRCLSVTSFSADCSARVLVFGSCAHGGRFAVVANFVLHHHDRVVACLGTPGTTPGRRTRTHSDHTHNRQSRSGHAHKRYARNGHAHPQGGATPVHGGRDCVYVRQATAFRRA